MNDKTLSDLGWSEQFARQLTAADAVFSPARVAEIHRDRLVVVTPEGSFNLHPREASGAYAVGDWVLTDGTSAVRRLTPVSDLSRRAAGPGVAAQRIAANGYACYRQQGAPAAIGGALLALLEEKF